MKSTNSKLSSGFSLFEILIVVSLLGIMAAFAIPFYGYSNHVQQATNRQNAQTLCTLAFSASAAGAIIPEDGEDKLTALSRLAQGVTIQSGVFAGKTFRVPHLSKEELEGAAKFVDIQDGQLVYAMTKSDIVQRRQ